MAMSAEALLSALLNLGEMSIRQHQQEQEQERALTQNGALSNAVADLSSEREGLISLFYKTVRGINTEDLMEYLHKSSIENVLNTILITFYIRDCRGGKGEREIGRLCFDKLMQSPSTRSYLEKVLRQIPEYGRWDDLILLSSNVESRKKIYKILYEQLLQDRAAMDNKQPCSILAKWMPTEKHRLDKQLGFVEAFCNYARISKKQYRRMLSSLRDYLNILERKMCNGEWSVIDYSTVPSCAMHRFKKAFHKHDDERFNAWKRKLNNPAENKVKVNAGQLFPYEIVQNYDTIEAPDELLEAQWKVLVEQAKQARQTGSLQNSLVVCDVSGSMTSRCSGNIQPLHVAVSLALLLSEITSAPFDNKVITFSERPVFFNAIGNSLYDRIKKLKNAPWGMNTNLQAVFQLILRTADFNRTSKENMPKRIIIISDMQFDQACHKNHVTNFQQIDQEYHRYGYERPQIVFWNVNGTFKNFPVQIHDTGAVLISGFNAQIIKYLLDDKDITPWNIVMNTLSNERYERLRVIMSNAST
jgi:hypothetical protein